jgi:hypothetical protein
MIEGSNAAYFQAAFKGHSRSIMAYLVCKYNYIDLEFWWKV